MSQHLSRKQLFPIIGFIFLDILAVGMGVPLFVILLGFIVAGFLRLSL